MSVTSSLKRETKYVSNLERNSEWKGEFISLGLECKLVVN